MSNIVSMKRTKSGNIAIIVGQEFMPVALRIFTEVSASVMDAGEITKERTLSDVRQAVEKGKIALKLNTPYLPKTTTGIPMEREEIRQEARTLVSELCGKDRLQYGTAWNKAYRLLYNSTGFDVRKVKLTKVKGNVSLIDTVLDNGRGPDFLRSLRRYLDK